MTLLTQVVILHWKEGGEQHKQKLYDNHLDGSGRLDWVSVETVFGADLVEIVDVGRSSLLRNGQWEGFTLDTFQPGSIILVTVSRKAQGEC